MKAPTMTIRVDLQLRHAEAIQRGLEDVRAGTADAQAVDQDDLEARWEDRLARSLA